MIFTPTAINGLLMVGFDMHHDHRGSFTRTYCSDEFASHGIDLTIVQTSFSSNAKAGTLRGLHFQAEPKPEAKLVRCTRGEIFDVVVDLRATSPTYCQWTAFTLNQEVDHALFIPPGCAHGFLTLTDSAEASYSIGTRYVPHLARGIRWDDPLLGIEWPFPPTVLSDRDATFPDFVP